MVYLMKAERSGLLKVGLTTNKFSLKSRLKDLSYGYGPITVLATREGGPTLESRIHKACRPWHATGEWFIDSDPVRYLWATT